MGVTKLRNISYVGTLVTDITATLSDGTSVLIIYALFIGKISHFTIHLPSEFSEYEWVSLDVALEGT